MSVFTVRLLASDAGETLPDVTSFVGEDASGSFGLLAHHAPFMTILSFGLARLRLAGGSVRYLGVPGGVLTFADNELRVATRRYLLGDDAAELAAALTRQVLADERTLARSIARLREIEARVLQGLAELQRG